MYYLVPCMWRWEQEVNNFEHDRVFLIWIRSRRPSFTLEKSTHARSHCFWRLHFRFAENSRSSRLLSSLSSFSSSSSSLLFQLLQKAGAKYRCFFRVHVPCDQQCEGFNSRKCFYENISGKWQVRVLTHFPRDYFFSLTFNNHTVENAEVPISPAEASVYWNPAQLQKVLCVKTACF